MILIERIEQLQRRANDLSGLQARLDETRRLQTLQQQAEKVSKPLGQQVQGLRLFRDQDMDLHEVPASAASALKTLDRLRTRFAKDRRAENLTRGQDWKRMESQVQETSKIINRELDNEWKQFVTTAYSGETPANLERTLAPTDSNRGRLSRYGEAHRQLMASARTLPTARIDFENGCRLARQLAEIHQGFDFNVPEAVGAFLKAIGAGGAGLELLTEEVRNWLTQQGTAGRYRIVARQ